MSVSQRDRQRIGAANETATRLVLMAAGVEMVERVHTPWRIVRDKRRRIIRAEPVEKVAGDFRGVTASGRSVLVEAKHRDENLAWSDLEPHQRRALSEHHAHGGLSLVAWGRGARVYLLEWPVMLAAGFKPRRSLSPEWAEGATMRPLWQRTTHKTEERKRDAAPVES